ncbi:MAG: hypothetical protein A3B23_01545 [Candidatus Colwellbacteria bacterium RIFCSPLOWO2_01_FULL_48_10]|uniref:Peptidoglycan binding-like domain-containing protein n=1 Tax=Candidatus Colwellbacteria bacterium RIFCSPLOWO2_01_FULL_48_10 TaxID=1797690 RepID=A0A1G1Z377_9BACT|nr:MAG: hypothetical protein A3B23_01545 [Candidatus Colwellbacteria bacterium RIFCSPLOWO2_01_FULL_48_10]
MTKNKIKLGLATIGAVVAMSFSVGAVYASNLNYSADTNVNLTGNGATLTIKSGSDATSLVINASSIDVVVPAGTTDNTFTVTLPNLVDFSPASGSGGSGSTATQSCSGTTNTAVITTTAASAGTYTITPNGGVCNTGGGGGGGGGGSPTPTDTTAPVSTSISINGGASVANTTAVTLTLGAVDSSGVSSMMIANDSAFTGATFETYATTKAWTLTSGNGAKIVYAKFKDSVGNISAAVSDSINLDISAVVTPVTPVSPTKAEQIATLQAQINALVAKINAAQAGQSGQVPKGILTKALNIGAKGNEVTVLQNFLKAQGADIYPEGLATGYFGSLTKKAIQRFQLKYGIVAKAGDPGYGTLGPKTRAKINELNK